MSRAGKGAASVALVVTMLTGASQASAADDKALFDGRTLAGWEQGASTAYRVEDGQIVGGQLETPLTEKTFLCTTAEYGDFHLTAEIKLVGRDPNSGIQFRTQRVTPSNAVSGYQADAGQTYWGTIYDEGRRNRTLTPVLTDTSIVHSQDWNTMEVTAKGPHIVIRLNGVETANYTEADPAIATTGHICLQLHSGPPSQAWFRNLTLAPL